MRQFYVEPYGELYHENIQECETLEKNYSITRSFVQAFETKKGHYKNVKPQLALYKKMKHARNHA